MWRPVVALMISLGVLIGIGALAGGVAENYATGSLDQPVERSLEGAREPWVVDVMAIVTEPGSSMFLIPFVIVLGVGWWMRRRDRRPLVVLLAAYGGSLALTYAVKAIVDRARPIQKEPAEIFTGSAFPSGHAAKATAVFLVLGALLTLQPARPRRRVVVWSAVLVATLLVAASRLFLGAHWLTDVIGGVALGALWGLAVHRFTAVPAGTHSASVGAGSNG